MLILCAIGQVFVFGADVEGDPTIDWFRTLTDFGPLVAIILEAVASPNCPGNTPGRPLTPDAIHVNVIPLLFHVDGTAFGLYCCGEATTLLVDSLAPDSQRGPPLMVPNTYHPFFSGCASVAGALIGLLFVAISVAPHKLAGERAEVAFQVGAGVAFTALLNTLVVALVALLPGTDLKAAAILLATIGTSSVAGLVIVSLRAGEVQQNLTGLIRLGALLVVLVLQFIHAVRALGTRHEGWIHFEAVLCLILFVIAINQAWKLLDAQSNRLFPVVAQLLRQRHPITAESPHRFTKDKGGDGNPFDNSCTEIVTPKGGCRDGA
jgi:hypothetical protein